MNVSCVAVESAIDSRHRVRTRVFAFAFMDVRSAM